MAVREGLFMGDRTEPLVEGTVRGAFSHVVQAFRVLGRQNPMKDADNMLSVLLSQQFRVYKNDDPKEVQQKALPFSVLNELGKRQVSELDRAIAQLTISAAFFACRSCEYLRLPQREMKCTKLLCLRNIRFFKDGHLTQTDYIAPSDHDASISMCNHRQCSSRLRAGGNWHALSLFRRRDGNVPSRGTSVHHHAHRQMVQRCILTPHSKAS
jgi:hypothetical protein